MSSSLKVRVARLVVVCCLLAGSVLALASPQSVLGNPDDTRLVTVIVEMKEPPLAALALNDTQRNFARLGESRKLDFETPEAQDHLASIEEGQRKFRKTLEQLVPASSVRGQYNIALNGLAVTLPASKVDDLRRMPGVKGVFPSRTFFPTLDVSVPLINAPALWTGLGGESQAGLGRKVAVLDTGIDQTQPFLTDNSLVPPVGFPKGDPAYVSNKVIVAKVYAPPGQTGTLAIEHSHGTHVAGIAAGIPNYSVSAKIIAGVAPKAFLMNYKVLLGTGGSGETPEIVQAIDDAVADGADVVNMSFGGAPDPASDEPLFTAIRNGTAAGVVFVASAGNSGSSPGTILTPAISPGAITVGASNDSDAMESFSSRGPTADLLIKPDITAPGLNIFSSLPGSQFGYRSGTSMSAPHVSGAVALLKQLHLDWTPAQVKSALITTAKLPVYEGAGQATVMDRGGGRIDLQQAMAPGLTIDPASYSFRQMNVGPDGGTRSEAISIRDVSGISGTWSISVTQVSTTPGLQAYSPASSVAVSAGGMATVTLVLSGTTSAAPGDYEGYLALQRDTKVLHIPYFVRTVYLPYRTDFPLILKDGVLP